jgi:coenzyme PQQ precursor peptide PqqA
MREWHTPTIEETESGMEVTSYLPAELDRAYSVLLISEHSSGGPAMAGSPFRFSGVASDTPNRGWSCFCPNQPCNGADIALRRGRGKGLPNLPVQIFLMWYPASVHWQVMRYSFSITILRVSKSAWTPKVKDRVAAII